MLSYINISETIIKTYETNNCMLALAPLGNSCISRGIMHANSRESLVLCASQTCPNLFVMLCSPVDVMCCVRVCSHVTLAHHPVIVAYIYYHADAHLWNVYGKLKRTFSIWWQKAVALNVNLIGSSRLLQCQIWMVFLLKHML